MIHTAKKCLVLLLIAVLLFTCNSCTDSGYNVLSMSAKSNENIFGSGNSEFHTLTGVPEKSIASSGLTTLYFEPSTAAVCVAEITKGNVWSVLPLFSNGAASTVDVVLRTSKGTYYLNSQDNSVAFGSYDYHINENGVTVNYLIADKKENTSGSLSSITDGAAVKLSVDFVLKDGDLRVSTDCGKIELSEGAVLEKITLMPYFGAVKKNSADNAAELENAVWSSAVKLAGINEEPSSVTGTTSVETEKNDEKKEKEKKEEDTKTDTPDNKSSDKALSQNFILVPDGSGAVMLTDKEDSSTSDLSFDVYGGKKNGAQIPVFGVKKGSGAFAAIIDEGAPLAQIKARRAEKDPFEAATVYPVFTVTEFTEISGRYNYSEMYKGNISVCYRFMAGSEANYVSMASACREELIRNGTLSSKTVPSDIYPLVLSVVVSVDGTSKRTVSAFEETEDLLQLLKAKGVENINVILGGMFSGGISRPNDDKIGVLRSAGGTSGLQKLYDYASKQKFKVYAGANLIKSAGVKNGDSAVSIGGGEIKSVIENPLGPEIGQNTYETSLISSDKIKKKTVSLMTKAEQLPITGLCIVDADTALYSDRASGFSKASVSETLSENIAAVSTRKELALVGCSFNVIKNASLLSSVPLNPSFEENDAYKSVPLIPAVLHSTVLYSGTPVNYGTAAQLELLKCVEYGAVPNYLWVFDRSSHYYYENTFNDAVSFVIRASQELNDLTHCRIVSHKEAEPKVFCTGYDNGSLVYVNYNNYSVNIGDISVLPYDYIRIN